MKRGNNVHVHVFDPEEHGLGKASFSSERDRSKKKSLAINTKPTSSLPLNSSQSKSSLASSQMDKALLEKYEDMADLEIDSMWSILEKLKESSLTGRDRRKYLVEKAASLSGTSAHVAQLRAPFKTQMKLISSKKERDRKKREMEIESSEGYILKKKSSNDKEKRKKR